MKKEFSFNYGEKQCTFAVQENAVYELGKDVTVKVICKDYPEFNASYWTLYFENNSDKNSEIVSDIWDCNTLLPLTYPREPRHGFRPVKGDACVITMNGMVMGDYYWDNDKVSATEYNFNYEYLDKTPAKSFTNIGGRSSDGIMPFFDVTANDDGYIAAIGWTGDWKTEYSKVADGIIMKSGLKETRFYLKPGEKIRTSSTLIMGYTATEDKHNKFRKLIKNHFSHKSNNSMRDGIMACELWGGLTSEEMIKRINDFKNYDINFEDVWLDAGWYGQCQKCDEPFTGDWSAHTGEWDINTRIHPNNLTDVRDAAKDAGMKLMFWVEPERAIKGTKLTEEHPDWFLKLPNTNNTILNYGNREALEYVFDLLSNYVSELELSCYRQDFNTELTEYFKAYDEENRRGITEIKHITGMYEIWDRLLEKYPHLIIDNCSSGGRRIDIETLKRSIPFFRSDYQCNFNENSEVLQVHNSNISCYLPYNGCTSKTKCDTYATRSSFSSSWGGAFYNAVFQSMSEDDLKWAKKITDEYRRIRKYLSQDFFNHASVTFDDTAWTIWQYHDNDAQSGIVMAFRRENSPFENVEIELKSTFENKEYLFENLDTNAEFCGNNKLKIELADKRSCVIIEYKIK